MRRLRLILWPAGFALAVAAEWVSHDGGPALTAADAVVGCTLIALGLVIWGRRTQTLVGPIMSAAGGAWFLGAFGAWALYLHRGLLAHLVLSYPAGRLRSRLERAAVATAYVYAVAYPVAREDYATLAFASGLAVVACWRYVAAGGAERRARASALVAATALAIVLALGAATRLAGVDAEREVLWTYDVVVLLVAVELFADLLWGRWRQAAVTGLVVDLGDAAAAGTLRDKLARALGDPTLAIGYWLAEQGRYVDERGGAVALPLAGGGRAVTPIAEGGEPIAILVHDSAVLDDPGLVAAVASGARLAVSNVRLQARMTARLVAVARSRRRIVEAADVQRRRLELELRDGAELRLAHVADLLEDCGEPLADVRATLDVARSELRELARGIHPAALTDGGLTAALAELAARSPIAVEVTGSVESLAPAVEAAAYFVCAEALANVAKHAVATRAEVAVTTVDGRLRLRIADDGAGGADPTAGTGLRGLADRVEALGGRLRIESVPGAGTRLDAEIPLT